MGEEEHLNGIWTKEGKERRQTFKPNKISVEGRGKCRFERKGH
jgi:hypothetical protein